MPPCSSQTILASDNFSVSIALEVLLRLHRSATSPHDGPRSLGWWWP